jgi:ABC transporter substrate binding protein (PQQ-dependent alcohol dehydrogenase system)
LLIEKICASSLGVSRSRRRITEYAIQTMGLRDERRRCAPVWMKLGCAALAIVLCGRAAAQPLTIAYMGQERAALLPVSPLEKPEPDNGLEGGRLAIADNATTGRFTGHAFHLREVMIRPGDDAAAALRRLAAEKVRFVVADLDAEPLLQASAAPEQVILNARAPDDGLRDESCRANLLHTVPSRAMLADGLAQYLVAKRWRRWFLVVGRHDGDKLFARALRRAAKRFGVEIVTEKEWRFQPGNARADTGHVTLQSEIPAFTQVADHDVLVVADEANEFGEYLPGRTARPRPVAGTHGLVATGWSPVNEQWGAAQLHSRFEKRAGRRMGARDYAVWAAVRAIGEAAARTKSTDLDAIAAYLRGPDFILSGFKGQGQSFRSWDGQMRQPILIAGPRMLVSVSPQAGFLHRGSELDTLGIDREESRCKF